MDLNELDIAYLERAIDLADRARGCTSPNPVVGAVIARGAEILGEGYHVGPGQDHAEVVAIKDALRRAGAPAEAVTGRRAGAGCQDVCAGTTLYVTLEPCCTYGRTPPCTEALVAAGFSRVVVGAVDPSPEVNGRGLDLLREAGIQVDLAGESLALRVKRQNNGQRKAVMTGLPFVTYKYAMTMDGRIATDSGDSKWISSAESRALVHQWRAWSDAVVVGAGTMLADDPRLTAREVECQRQPLRVVIDQVLDLSRHSALVQSVGEGPVLVVCGEEVPKARRAEVESWGMDTVAVPVAKEGRLDPLAVGRHLVERGAQSVLLEGGPRLAGAWWTAGLIDKVAAFVCPLIVSGWEVRGPLCGDGAVRMEDVARLREVEVQQVGSDVLLSGYTGEPF